MRWATHQFMHHLSRIRGRTDTEMWREKRGKGNFGVSISCTKGGTKGAKNCHMSHALVVLFYGEAVCQVLSNMIQSVFRLVLSSGEIQGWPKELVMGCENFSNLCVVIGGTIGGVGRWRFLPLSLAAATFIGVSLFHRPFNELDRRRAGRRRRIFFESADLPCRRKLPSLCTHCGWMAYRQADLLFTQSTY